MCNISDKFQTDIFLLRSYLMSVVSFTLLSRLVAGTYCRLLLFCYLGFFYFAFILLPSSHRRKRRFPLQLFFSTFSGWKIAMSNSFMSAIIYREASECIYCPIFELIFSYFLDKLQLTLNKLFRLQFCPS